MGMPVWPVPTGNIEQDRKNIEAWRRGIRRDRWLGVILGIVGAAIILAVAWML
jgi:hypothetical protein